jgi:hypothetical protein
VSSAGSSDPAPGLAANDSAGFGASAADDKTDVSQIPDPATFGQAGQANKTSNGAYSAQAAGASAANAATATTAASATSEPEKPAATTSNVNPLLVAGLPLAAAALLMGVYWLVLRAGGV